MPKWVYGVMLAWVVLFFDQLTKWYFLEVVNMPARQIIEVLPFFNLVMVWNTGVSFGMFQGMESGPFILSSFAFVIVMILAFWMRNMTSNVGITGVGLIMGGAIGNVIDRLRFGAVADFFDVHVAGYHWPAFNIADSAIVIGAGLLILYSVRSEQAKEEHDHSSR